MADELSFTSLAGNGDENDDLESLFGGDDDRDTDLTSLFTEVASAESSSSLEPDREPESSLLQERPQPATNHAAQLRAPEPYAQPQSDQQPALSLPQPHPRQLHLPAVPDPLGASLSHQDGHTSGDLVVSTQESGPPVASSVEALDDDDAALSAALQAELEGLWDATPNEEYLVNADAASQQPDVAPDGDAPLQADEGTRDATPSEGQPVSADPASQQPDAIPDDDASLQAELEGLWDAIASEEQPPVDADVASQRPDVIPDGHAPPDEDDMLPTRIPGFRYANSNTNLNIRLPRRIDGNPKRAEELMFYITLNRNTKVEILYEQLELGIGDGKRLGLEMKKVLKEPPLIHLVEQRTSRPSETKRTLIRIAYYMLVAKEWGNTWFGDGCSTAASRNFLWPRDSSVILAAFVMFLYRIFTNQRQMYQTAMRRGRPQNADTEPGRSASPPSPASASSEPSSPGRPPVRPSVPPSVPSASAPHQTPPPSPEGQSFFEALAHEAAATKKRKAAESVLAIPEPEEVEVPANARLKYRVYVKDAADGRDLAPPTTYRHVDYMISRGAFTNLKASFEAAGQDPKIEIQTPFERRRVMSERDWEQAVLYIYSVRRSGGVVEVDVFV